MDRSYHSNSALVCELMANLESQNAGEWRWALRQMLAKENPWPPAKLHHCEKLRCEYQNASTYLCALDTAKHYRYHLGPKARIALSHVKFEQGKEVAVMKFSPSQLGLCEHEDSLEKVHAKVNWLGFTLLPQWAGPALRLHGTPCTTERIMVLTEPISNPEGGPCEKEVLFAVETNEQASLFTYRASPHTIYRQFEYLVGVPQEMMG
jgi:hypothetical protein